MADPPDEPPAQNGSPPVEDGRSDAPEPLTREDLTSPRRSLTISGDSIGLVVIVLLGLLMGAFILGRVTAPEDDSSDPAATAPTSRPLEFPTGDADRAGYWAFGGVTVAVTDPFDRADAGELGAASDGEPWEVVAGEWGIEDNRATGRATGDEPAIAVIRGGAARRLTEVTFATVEPGAGLVFRYSDPANLWAIVVGDGQWEVVRAVDGVVEVVGTVPLQPADGVTVSVSQTEQRLQIFVDGTVELEVTDPALAAQRRSGLLAPRDGSGTVRWDRFFVGNLAP